MEFRSLLLLIFFFFLFCMRSWRTSLAYNMESLLRCFTSHGVPSDLLMKPDDAAYSGALWLSVYNSRFILSNATSKPAIIVTATTAAHAQATVICCKANGMPLRVRSGGHDFEGMSYTSSDLTTPFVLLDLGRLRSISVDHESGTAWAEAGASLGELYYAIGAKNRTAAFPAGVCPMLGLGGHLSGGGIGTLTRMYGTAADNVIDAEIIDVEGRLLDRKTMGEDLFWAIRGGGATSFGVVVSFKVRIVAVPETVTTFNVERTLEQDATRLVHRWQSIAPLFDKKLYIRVRARAAGKGMNRTISVLFNSMYLGGAAEALLAVEKSFPELGLTAGDCKEMRWAETIAFLNGWPGDPMEFLLDRRHDSNPWKGKSDLVTRPIEEKGWEAIWKFLMGSASGDEPGALLMEPLGGKMSEIEESAIAYPHRKGNLYKILYGMKWSETDPAVTAKHLAWMKDLYEFMTPFVSKNPRAAYYNYKDIDLGRNAPWQYGHSSYNANYEAVDMAWGGSYFKGNFKRLGNVKYKVDPHNFFRNEQSIPPLPLLVA